MKYSLRSLVIVVTLFCVVLGGRIEYLRRRAEFHEREAAKLGEGSLDIVAYHVHTSFAQEYRRAMSRPWLNVDDSPPYFPNPFARLKGEN